MSAIDPGRLHRAIWLDAQRIGDGRYKVVGGTRLHVVDLSGDYPECDCEDRQFNGTVFCKHALCCLLSQGNRETLLALRKLVIQAPVAA